MGGDDDIFVGTPGISDGPIQTDVFGGTGNDELGGVAVKGGTLDGGPGDDTLGAVGAFTLTGGEGADTFKVASYENELIIPDGPTIITDIDFANEALNLTGIYPEVPTGTAAETSIDVTSDQIDGVEGALVSASVTLTGTGEVLDGPQVFLQGIDSADVPVDSLEFTLDFLAQPTFDGSDGDETLGGNSEIGAINGLGGDDIILSFGADGPLRGGEGDDTISLTEGSGQLIGGDGSDVFVVTGKEGGNDPTIANIRDFDPATETIVISAQQSSVGEGQVALDDTNIRVVYAQVDTEFGPATQIRYEPLPGFEGQTSQAGFATVNVIGVERAALTDDNVIARIDESETQDEQVTYTEALGQAARNYGSFKIGTSGDDDMSADGGRFQKMGEAIYGLDGSDKLIAPDSGMVDLFGGGGDDRLSGYLGAAGNWDGGAGEDRFFTDGNAVMTGGEGTDTFGIFGGDYEVFADQQATITDFELGTETLTLSATYDSVLEGTEGDALVAVENTTVEGVSGALVNTSFEFTDARDDLVGPSVFLQGIDANDVTEGMFEFDVRFFGRAPT